MSYPVFSGCCSSIVRRRSFNWVRYQGRRWEVNWSAQEGKCWYINLPGSDVLDKWLNTA
ncbi:MAG: hypothetical protein ACXAC5_02120 [Promethearchaeota archaeon]